MCHLVSFRTPSTLASIIWGYIGILWGKLMPMLTLGFNFVAGSDTIASENILPNANDFHMSRVNTQCISTQMVNGKFRWYFTYKGFIGKAVGKNRFFAFLTKLTILLIRTYPTPAPNPTFSSGIIPYLSPESLLRGNVYKPTKFISHNINNNTGIIPVSIGGI